MNTNEGGSKTVALMAQKPLDFIQMKEFIILSIFEIDVLGIKYRP